RPRLPGIALLESLDQFPHRSRDEHCEEDFKDKAEHDYAPGFCSPPWADRRVSSARLAAWPSGLFGSMASTCSQALVAPARSCLPNARTMPTFSRVLGCLGSIASDLSNCTSALSG